MIQWLALVQSSHIVAEYGSLKSAHTIIRPILEQIKPGKQTFLYLDHAIHYLSTSTVTALAVTKPDESRKNVFHVLTLLIEAYENSPDEITSRLEELIKTNDIGRDVRDELDEVRGIMTQNIERVLDRGERMGLLIDKTSALQSNSLQFRHKSRAVSREMWWQRTKLTLIMTGCGVIGTYLLIGVGCGLPLYGKCVH